MTAAPPRFRNDLAVSEQQTVGGAVLIVKDPISGAFYRFRETERFIARQFDGATPLEVIRQRTERQFGALLPAQSLDAFVRNLERAGLLEPEVTKKPERPARRGRPGRIRGTLLYLRFKIADPNPLFDRLARRIRGCFTPQFLVLSAAAILLAAGTALANWSDIVQDLSRLYRLSAIPFILAVMFLVGSAHEFAHGLTCKHFGGEVREVGFLLMYFQPAMYTNVSDAWLFPEKSKRLWVSFAGPYFELFLWALAVVTWRLTPVDTWVNDVALIVTASSGLKTLLNLTPLLKLDGYYMLSDYLGMPNLRRKSFRYVGSRIKRLLGRTEHHGDDATRRERRIYLAYGLLTAVPSLCLLGLVAVKLSGFLIESNRPLALALFLGMLSTKVRRRAARLFGTAADDELGTATDDADHSESRLGAASPKLMRGQSRSLKALALGGIAAALVVFGRMELRIAGPFTILPVHNADVRSEIDGIIEHVYVTAGDEVRAGALVARLSDRADRAELLKTQAQIRQTRARLSMLEIGPTREDIDLARTAVDRARDGLTYARARLARNKELADSGVLTQTELENTQEQATIAGNDVAEAQNKLEVLLRGARPQEIEATRADISRLEAQERYLEGQVLRAEVRSPVAGMVATPARQLKELVGQAVQPGMLVAQVYDLKTVTVEVPVPEREIADVKVGQQVALKARAYPNRTFQGRVTSIATIAETGPPAGSAGPSLTGPSRTPKTVLVTSEIDNDSLLLKPGMTGQAKVYGGRRSLLDLMMRRLALTVKVNFWSWW